MNEAKYEICTLCMQPTWSTCNDCRSPFCSRACIIKGRSLHEACFKCSLVMPYNLHKYGQCIKRGPNYEEDSEVIVISISDDNTVTVLCALEDMLCAMHIIDDTVHDACRHEKAPIELENLNCTMFYAFTKYLRKYRRAIITRTDDPNIYAAYIIDFGITINRPLHKLYAASPSLVELPCLVHPIKLLETNVKSVFECAKKVPLAWLYAIRFRIKYISKTTKPTKAALVKAQTGDSFEQTVAELVNQASSYKSIMPLRVKDSRGIALDVWHFAKYTSYIPPPACCECGKRTKTTTKVKLEAVERNYERSQSSSKIHGDNAKRQVPLLADSLFKIQQEPKQRAPKKAQNETAVNYIMPASKSLNQDCLQRCWNPAVKDEYGNSNGIVKVPAVTVDANFERVMKPPFHIVGFPEIKECTPFFVTDVSNLHSGAIGALPLSCGREYQRVMSYLRNVTDTMPYQPIRGEYILGCIGKAICRGRVKEVFTKGKEPTYEVFFIDVGNTDTLTSQNIRRYPLDFTMNCHTMQCHIENFVVTPKNLNFVKSRIQVNSVINVSDISYSRENGGTIIRIADSQIK